MDGVVQDLRFGARILSRSPALSAAIAIALALGIGANSAMFSVVYGVLLKPLPYNEPNRLVMIWERDPQGGTYGATAANYLDWQTQSHSFSSIAGWMNQGVALTGVDRPEQVVAGVVTPNFFATLGVTPSLGRTFLPDEGGVASASGPPHVVVLSYRFWQDHFGGDPNILGRYITLDRSQFAVIGVMPPEFKFISRRQELWTPIAIDPSDREYHYLVSVGRLRSGVTLETASVEMKSIAHRLEQEYSKTNKGWTVGLESLNDWAVQGNLRRTLWLLLGAVGFVLLIACVNIASLLLSRSASRQREIAVRVSLGATRIRLVRQLLTESILLSLIGALLGLGLAYLLVRASPAIIPQFSLPPVAAIGISNAVLIFTLGIALGTGIIFGLAPALQASNPDLQASLKDGGRSVTGGRGSGRVRRALLVGEIAIAIVLLAGATLMIRSLLELRNVNLGFRPENVLTLNLYLQQEKYSESARVVAYYRQALQRLRSLPGVAAASVSSNLPLQRFIMRVPFELEGAPPREPSDLPDVNFQMISPGYLKALGIALLKGRDFEESDTPDTSAVILVNEAFVRRHMSGIDPIGRHVRVTPPLLGQKKFAPLRSFEIVGVIGSTQSVGVGQRARMGDTATEADPEIYVPYTQTQWSAAVSFAVRTVRDPALVAAGARAEVQAIDKDQPINRVSTMELVLAESISEPRFRAQLMGVFSGLALILATLGIYGVAAFAIAQRGHEFGIRIALGADSGNVLALAVKPIATLAAIGIVAGVSAALVMNRVLKGVLYGISSTDPVTLIVVSGILAIVALIAAAVPAYRATRIDPVQALREE